MMTIEKFAEGLNGRSYMNEITKYEIQRAAELGYVIVFGYSDDCAEFRGAIDDEVDCYSGRTVFEKNGFYINAEWSKGDYSWQYDTNIPHSTFEIFEDGEKYCKGIVFSLTSIEENKQQENMQSLVKPHTYFDLIKSMDINEMVNFICSITEDEETKIIFGKNIPCCTPEDIRQLLESEVEDI